MEPGDDGLEYEADLRSRDPVRVHSQLGYQPCGIRPMPPAPCHAADLFNPSAAAWPNATRRSIAASAKLQSDRLLGCPVSDFFEQQANPARHFLQAVRLRSEGVGSHKSGGLGGVAVSGGEHYRYVPVMPVNPTSEL